MSQEQWMEERRKEIDLIVTAHRSFCTALKNDSPSPNDSLTSDEATDRLLTLLTTQIEAARREEREKVMGLAKFLREEYKNNPDYSGYGTLDENICHDDGYMDGISDIETGVENLDSLPLTNHN